MATDDGIEVMPFRDFSMLLADDGIFADRQWKDRERLQADNYGRVPVDRRIYGRDHHLRISLVSNQVEIWSVYPAVFRAGTS